MHVQLKKYRQASADEIARAEAELGVTFPDDYKAFLAQYDGASIADNTFDDDLNLCVRSFLPVSELARAASSIERLPRKVWPIADDSNGNYFYIRNVDHAVYFWDHEVEDGDIRLADSFNAFVNRLRPFDPATAPLPPHRVVSGWVDPNFKPKFD